LTIATVKLPEGTAQAGVFKKNRVLTYQWPFQEPKMEVPTIYKAYCSGLNFREYPQKIWPEKWYVYVPPSVGS
jgi:hypothetical protein